MHHKMGINTVFRRYNVTVVVAFIVIILAAFSVASLRYLNQISAHKAQSLTSLKQEAEQLNILLEQSVQAVVGIKEFAEYILKHPVEINAPLPSLSQEGNSFYLNKPIHDVITQGKRLSSNITGIGQIKEFSTSKKQELAMANALTPAFIAAQNVIEEATWLYYISLNDFVNIYPWVDREVWQFTDTSLTTPHYQAMTKLTVKNNPVLWSSPYIDSAGTGMNASVGTGVFHLGKLLGAVNIDINLSRLHASLPELDLSDQGLILYNQKNEILLSKRLGKESLSYRASWQDLLPDSLQNLSSTELLALDASARYGEWLIEKQTVAVNGWVLLKYQNYESFSTPQYNDFIFVFSVLFIGLLAFLMLVNSMTKRTFIKPTTEFINHIQYCAEGDPGKVKPTPDWLHWFQVVEDIFVQNRTLLLQLKEQNDVLDSRVIEKTRELQETSTQHQRDYALLRSVMNAIPELIVFNDPNGRLMGCNQAFERFTGHSVQQMLGVKSSKFMPAALAKEINRIDFIDSPSYPKQELIQAGEFIYQGFSNQFSDDKDKLLGSISILRDVTTQQETQSALESARDQAEYANRVKIQFLANMSHEVRTPINAMQGMMDLLSHTSLDSRQEHYLINAQSASSVLLHLVDELLDLSKIEAGKMVVSQNAVNLPTIIDKALKLNLRNVNHDKVDVIIDMAANVPSNVLSDENRLVQVLANLFSNAIKFTEQGHITLIVNALQVDDSSAQVMFKVIDTGIGIAKENQNHLFKAFSQADESMTRKYGGSGLGLSICQQIIKLLGGKIELNSELGQGSELSFVLPLQRVLAAPTDASNNIDNIAHHSVTHNSITHLPMELDTPLVEGISLFVVKQQLSESLLNSFEKMKWLVITVNHINELPKGDIPNDSIILLNEVDFNEVCDDEEVKDTLTEFKLLCMCQPTLKELQSKSCEGLDSLSIPYLLIDLPIYRFALDQISQALFDNKGHSIEMVNTKQKDNAAISSQLEKAKFIESYSATNAQKFTQQESHSAPLDNQERSLAGITVLLVEDNLVNQLVAKELLLSLKAEVTIADNGKMALETLEKEPFDVVLMDIQMPVMDGLTACRHIRENERYKFLPIIAMTAHAREEDKKLSLEAGMNLHLAKPIKSDALLSSIKEVLTSNG